jgi:hypothetical protein
MVEVWKAVKQQPPSPGSEKTQQPGLVEVV